MHHAQVLEYVRVRVHARARESVRGRVHAVIVTVSMLMFTRKYL